jgi:hypothetical protein
MLSTDRFVGVFGSVAAGDLSQIVKVGVAACRQGFGIVPCAPGTADPVCTLTATAAKKDPDHKCYHVITDDKQARTILSRLTRTGDEINLAVDLEASKMAVYSVVDPEHATVYDPDAQKYQAWCELTEGEEPPQTGHVLVPPSIIGGHGLQIVGQTNKEDDGMPEDIWKTDDAGVALREMSERVAAIEEVLPALKNALKVALTTLQELKNNG